MHPNRSSRRRPAAALCLALALVVLFQGCAGDPEAPVFANPFDPATPGSEDPFNLRAVYAEGRVTLTWTPVAGHGIATYVVYWIYEGTAYELDRLEAANGTMTFVVQDPVPNLLNAYLVRALGAGGTAAASSHVVPVQVAVPPILKLAGGGTQVRSRFVDLIVRAAVGDYVQVDTALSFATAVEAVIGPDSTAVVAGFDLGPRLSVAARCTVYARAAFAGVGGQPPLWSGADRLILSISFNTTFRTPDSTFTVAEPVTDLVISGQARGVASMRFASSAAGLADAPWLPAATLVEGWPLLDTTLPQSVHGEFLSEFGFTRTTTLGLTADNLAAASFSLVLPASRITPTRSVAVRNQAVATQMRISQYPDFHDAPWQAYAPEATITLAGEPGAYQVFAWFRNHWYESAILTEHVILAGAAPSVAFTHPTDGQIVQGGTVIELAGTATTHDAGQPVASVEVNTGEGWQAAGGTAHWSFLWSVPEVAADTARPLGVRATLAGEGGNTATAWIEVTIRPAAPE